MKLVNIHKRIKVLLLLITIVGTLSIQSQQTWTLQQCLDTALVYNKTLQQQRNNIDISRQKEAEVKSSLMPKLTFNTDYRYYIDLPYQYMPLSAFDGPDNQYKQVQFGVPHNINASLQISMPIYNSQFYGAIKTSQLASELTELQFQKTQEQIHFEISNLYYNAQILYHQLVFIDSNIINNKRLLKNIILLNKQLLATQNDVNKVELQLEQLKTNKELISSNYKQLMNSLKFSMGVSLEKKIIIDSNIINHKTIEYKKVSPIDIRVANSLFKIQTSELRTLKNSRLPSLSLYSNYGTTGYGFSEKPNEFLDFHPISFAGFQLSIPLFNGTKTRKKIKQKKIEMQNSQLQLSLLTAQLDMQIINAKQKRMVAQNSIETIIKQIELAKSVYNQTVIQQKQGIASLTDVLLADNALHEAQQNYLSAIVNYLKADLELKKVTGNISLRK